MAILLANFGISEAAVIKSNTKIIVQNQEVFEENTYLAGGKLNVSGQFRQDLFLIGGEVDFDGIVEGDLLILGGKVNLSGQVFGDTRIVSGESFIKSALSGDLVIIGGKTFLDNQSKLESDIIVASGEIEQNAILNDSTKLIAGKINFNGQTEHNLEITTQSLYLGDQSKIANLTYYSPSPLQKSDSAQITGQTFYNQIAHLKDVSVIKHTFLNLITFWVLLKFFTILILAFVLAYVFRIFTQKVVDLSWNSFGKSLLVGVLLTLISPIIFVLLFVSLIGLPMAFVFLFVWIFFMIIATVMSSIMVGALLKKILKKENHYVINFSAVAIGVILLTLIEFIPIFGDLTKLILNFVAFGSIARYLRKLIIK